MSVFKTMSASALIVLLLAVMSVQPASATASKTDAKWTWGIITGTLYLNKKETELLAVQSSFAGSLGVLLPPPFDVIAALGGAGLTALAASAAIDSKCIKIKSYGTIGVYGPNDKHGRWCR